MILTPTRKGLVVSVLAFAFYAIFFNLGQRNWINLYRLSKSQSATEAKVTGLHPESHRACDFSYVIDGRSYSHLESCHFSVGETTQLIYLSSDPSIAILSGPKGELVASIVAPICMSLLIGIFTTIRAWRESPRSLQDERLEKPGDSERDGLFNHEE